MFKRIDHAEAPPQNAEATIAEIEAPSTAHLGTESIGRLLWRLSVPAMVAMLVNALYNIVDRLYIGQGVGRDAIAGLTLTFPYMTILTAFGMLIGIGSGALLSLRLGEGRKQEAEKVIGQALALFMVLFATLPVLAWFTLDYTLIRFGGTPESIPYARDYLRIILYGNLFTHISFGMNHMIRAEGNARQAMYTMLIGAVANIILDPIFIFWFGMGIKGAAWATVLAMMISSFYVLRHFTGTKCVLRLRLRNIRINPRVAVEAMAIGLSPFSMQLIASAVMVVFTRAVRQYAADESEALNAIAAIGIANSVMLVMLMPIFGLAQGVQPIFGFNYGATQHRRVYDAFILVAKVATIICLISWLCIIGTAPWLARAFTRDRGLIEIASPALRKMGLAFPVIGISIMTSTYFQSIGRPLFAILLTLLRQAIILIPLLLWLPRWMGLGGIWYAMPASDLLTAFFVWFIIFREMSQLRRIERFISNHPLDALPVAES